MAVRHGPAAPLFDVGRGAGGSVRFGAGRLGSMRQCEGDVPLKAHASSKRQPTIVFRSIRPSDTLIAAGKTATLPQ